MLEIMGNVTCRLLTLCLDVIRGPLLSFLSFAGLSQDKPIAAVADTAEGDGGPLPHCL